MKIFDILLLVWSGAGAMLIGVVVGGLFVYRTKRDSHETFLPRTVKTSPEPINIDDGIFSEPVPEPEEDVVPDIFGKYNRDFLSQVVADGLKKEEKDE